MEKLYGEFVRCIIIYFKAKKAKNFSKWFSDL